MMDNIVYFSGGIFPDGNAAAHRCLSNARLMSELGFQVHLVGTAAHEATSSRIVNTGAFSECISFWEGASPKGLINTIKHVLSARNKLRFLKELKGRTALVIFYNYPSYPSFLLMRYLKRIGIRYAFDVTEWYDPRGRGLVRGFFKAVDTTVRIRFLASQSNIVLTTSPFMTRFFTAKKMSVLELPTLYDTASYSISEGASCDPLTGLRTIRLTYLGSPFFDLSRPNRIHLKERLDRLIDAVDFCADHVPLRLDVVGVDANELLAVYPELRCVLERLPNIITFHGRLCHREAIAVLERSDYSIFIKEDNRVNRVGFPSKLAESLTLKTPVIINDTPCLERFSGVRGVYMLRDSNFKSELLALLKKGPPEVSVDRTIYDFRKYREAVEEYFKQNALI